MKLSQLSSAVALCCASALFCSVAEASSHREAPNITRYPTLDSSDFYIFNSYEAGRQDYVTIIANYIPLQDPLGGPNYFAMDPAAAYAIHIDNDGDAVEDLTFQFRFQQALAADGAGIKLTIGPDEKQIAIPLKNAGGVGVSNTAALNFLESYKVNLISGGMNSGNAASVTQSGGGDTFTKPWDYIGDKTFTSAADYQAYANQYNYAVTIPGCDTAGQVFVGQRKDPFVVNLGETFDLVNYVPVEGDSVPGANDGGGFPGGITQADTNDDLRGKNVTSIALELPKSCITGDGNGVIGAWTTASVKQVRVQNPNATFAKPEVNGGAWVQVSRLSNPLVNELVIGLPDKDSFSTAAPQNDGQFADYVTHPSLPELLNILFKDAVNTTLATSFETIAPTNFPRLDLVAAFLTGFEGVNQQSTVTASEMLRLNTGIPAVPAATQSNMGVVGNDLAGFPNGRRPGDDVVDIALRVVMGRLCHDIPVGGTPTNLGLCQPEDANVGTAPFTDGAPVSASYLDQNFPYLLAPLAGSPN